MFLNLPASAFLVIVLVYGVCFDVSGSDWNVQFQPYQLRRRTYCQKTRYACISGQCINSYDKCDGKRDCADGSDETNAVCKSIKCPLRSFKCSYGGCIDETLRCDGKADCVDGSDEEGGCPPDDSLINRFISDRTPLCGDHKYRCESNGNCINKYDMCDGIKHCPDGADESRENCLNLVCPLRSFKCTISGACLDPSLVCNGNKDCLDGSDEEQRCPVRCRPGSFKCTYNGECLDPSLRCNGRTECADGSDEQGCTTPATDLPLWVTRPTINNVTPSPPTPSEKQCKLPAQPRYGSYYSPNCDSNDSRRNNPAACQNRPGNLVPHSWVLKYICNDGYTLSKDNDFSVCEKGEWRNRLDCTKLCEPLESNTVDVKCSFEGTEVPCNRPMKHNTTATAVCKQLYKPAYLPEYSKLVCLNTGKWSYRLFYCVSDCGWSTVVGDKTVEPLILNGTNTTLGEFPWLAAVYQNTARDRWEQQCGGTLVTTHIVITAAHCLVSNGDIKLRPNNIRVGLGKTFRNYYIQENYALILQVREVVIPDHYKGGQSQYALDIGLLDLVEEVQVSAFIMPACYNWAQPFNPEPNSVGMVAGWGRTGNGTASEVALSARLKYIKYGECIKLLSQVYRRFLTHDKFCGENIDGSQVDKGDSGGGLTFMDREGRHFLVGVVSVRIGEEYAMTIFLDLANTQHRVWLEKESYRLKQLHNGS